MAISKMGKIFPKRIRALINGDELTGKVSFNETDAKTKEILQREKDRKAEYSKIMESARVPLACPSCKNLMKKRLDVKYFSLRNKCMDCVIADEHIMRVNGTWAEYEANMVSKNALSMLEEAKVQIQYLLTNLQDKVEFVNESGALESYENTNVQGFKGFLQKELEWIDGQMEHLKLNPESEVQQIEE